MVLSNITVPLLGLVDTAVIGHLEHAYFLGGSTIGAMLITLVVSLCGFLRMSTTGLSAQTLGLGDLSKNLLVLLRGVFLAFIIGLLLILLQSPFLDIALTVAGGSEKVQWYAYQYAQIRIWGVPASLANLVILGWLIGNQQGKTVMWVLIATNLVNVFLDLVFVYVFNWQVQGVALASLLAEYSGMSLGIVFIAKYYKNALKKLLLDKQQFNRLLLNKQVLRNYFQLNRDILIRTLCLQACLLFITFQGARLGDTVVAANAILMNFLLLISFSLDGIANATEAMVGKAHGEKNLKELKRTVNISLFWSFIFACFYALLFAVFGSFFLTIISDIPSVIDFAQQYIAWMVLLPLVSCWCFLYDGVYIGLMQAKVMRNSMIVATFGCFFPVWYLLQDMGNHSLWAAYSAFMLVRGISLAWHFHYYQAESTYA
ncbi:MATE family efflux transporter [Colwellia ponticola]|uniref:MATE family efflux transporter n=2 Tax=Colwellia ponticola TaxID=2304625 RepID=A0A8H2PKE8_9GAMM|nr:MATE family efflux transporter [Colwellia ponticola]